MQVINVYVDDEKYPLEAIPRLLNRANQALSTLERYKQRLDTVQGGLNALEVEDLVTCATSSRCCSAPRWCDASPRRSS